MKIDVYVGPSLQAKDRPGQHPNLNYRPPIRHGDLFAGDYRPGDCVVVLDGLYHQNVAIRHKELLHFIDRGVSVLGAASLGALRAADLHEFGMIGTGEVFAAFRDGRLRDDDEVAVAHGPAPDYAPLTVPLVDVRDACQHGVRTGTTSRRAAALVLNTARGMTYGMRSWGFLVRTCAERWPEHAGEFQAFRATQANRPGVKSRDAVDCVSIALDLQPEQAPAALLSEVDFVGEWEIQDLRLPVAGRLYSAADVLAVVRLFHPDWPIALGRLLEAHWGPRVAELMQFSGVRASHNSTENLTELLIADPQCVPLRVQAECAAKIIDDTASEVVGTLDAMSQLAMPAYAFPPLHAYEMLAHLWSYDASDRRRATRQARRRGFTSVDAASTAVHRVMLATEERLGD